MKMEKEFTGDTYPKNPKEHTETFEEVISSISSKIDLVKGMLNDVKEKINKNIEWKDNFEKNIQETGVNYEQAKSFDTVMSTVKNLNKLYDGLMKDIASMEDDVKALSELKHARDNEIGAVENLKKGQNN